MFKFSNVKRNMLLIVGLSACLTIIGCSNKSNNDTKNNTNNTSTSSPATTSSVSPEQTKKTGKNETPVEAPNGNVLQLKLELLDSVNESDYKAILNKGKAKENYSFSAGGEIAKVSLCSTDSKDGTTFTVADEIDSYSNLSATDKLCICIDVPEGMPNSMLVLTYADKSVQKCLISYNGLDGGASLVPLNK